MRDSQTPGQPVDEFISDSKLNNAILLMTPRVRELNEAIEHLKKDGFVVQTIVNTEGKLAVSVELKPDQEPIRG